MARLGCMILACLIGRSHIWVVQVARRQGMASQSEFSVSAIHSPFYMSSRPSRELASAWTIIHVWSLSLTMAIFTYEVFGDRRCTHMAIHDDVCSFIFVPSNLIVCSARLAAHSGGDASRLLQLEASVNITNPPSRCALGRWGDGVQT